MNSAPPSGKNWVDELVRFLREEPAVRGVRIDPAAHRVAVATVGDAIDLASLEEKLSATIAGVEAQLAAKAERAPSGYALRREGAAMVIGRETCPTAETLWLWREMEWPAVGPAEAAHEEEEWRTLATLATVCGAAGVSGALVEYFAPGWLWLARGLFAAGLVAGGWDAAIDTWGNLKKREIDIHFLMLAVAVGAMFIGAWGEAVLLLFLMASPSSLTR